MTDLHLRMIVYFEIFCWSSIKLLFNLVRGVEVEIDCCEYIRHNCQTDARREDDHFWKCELDLMKTCSTYEWSWALAWPSPSRCIPRSPRPRPPPPPGGQGEGLLHSPPHSPLWWSSSYHGGLFSVRHFLPHCCTRWPWGEPPQKRAPAGRGWARCQSSWCLMWAAIRPSCWWRWWSSPAL